MSTQAAGVLAPQLVTCLSHAHGCTTKLRVDSISGLSTFKGLRLVHRGSRRSSTSHTKSKRRRQSCFTSCSAVTAEPSDPQDWQGTHEHHKHPPEIFYSKKGEKFLFQTGESMQLHDLPERTRVIYLGVRKDGVRSPDKMREMVLQALNNPVGSEPLRARLQRLKAASPSPKILFSFDDVSIPLPPMASPDVRRIIMEEAEAMCVEEGVTDVQFVCSIALHRFIRPDEFKHICGPRLFDKYHPHRMRNYNAVDKHESVHLGYTRHGEDVEICEAYANADMVIYANINYVSMDGGYKSYATGLVPPLALSCSASLLPQRKPVPELPLLLLPVHYNSLRHNHDSKTMRKTQSLYDPANSALHKSFNRMGRMMQKHTDVFHVETVLDEQTFPFFLNFVVILLRRMSLLDKLFMYSSVLSLKVVPLWLRMRIFWAVRGPFGLLQVTAGETQAVHERTLACNYRDKIIDVGKVFVVGATDPRGPEVLRWEMAPSIIDAVRRAREFLGKPKASVTYQRSPPIGYVRVRKGGDQDTKAAEVRDTSAVAA
eukprot:jgi/Mesen1/7746/ME000407S06961